MNENPLYLKNQILTYIGNKRALLGLIEQGVSYAKDALNKDKFSIGDLFAGSGIVSRYLKQHANYIVANDLELYSKIVNDCYLYNADEEFKEHLKASFRAFLRRVRQDLQPGFITELYAPKDDLDIQANERVFYTRKNAIFIDSVMREIKKLHPDMQKFFIAPLLYEASTHANTGGVFKGFYKNRQNIGQFGGEGRNALKRILGEIKLPLPVFSNFNVPYSVYDMDANRLVNELDKLDIIYLDPPYNQHPYGSNYFMLNLIARYKKPEKISKVAGISTDWNRSVYNQKAKAGEAFFDLINKLKAKIVLISFNSEGFISKADFEANLKKLGKLQIFEQRYNTFRASRNLKTRSIYVNEYLYVLEKI